MNLTYPGGPKIDKLAKEGTPNIELPKTHTDGLNFSFSGIKTAVINTNHNKKDIKKEDLCASFQTAVTNELIENTKKAIEQYGFKKIALAGGVSANSYIREQFQNLGKEKNIQIYYPELSLCTDNAAMIASAGYYNYLSRKNSRPNPKRNTKSKNRRKSMSIYAIADLHLSFETQKPMNIFGENWTNHEEKIKKDWLEKVKDQDTVILPGDFSWAMGLNEIKKDFEYLNTLPRKKNNAKRKPRLLVEQPKKTKRIQRTNRTKKHRIPTQQQLRGRRKNHSTEPEAGTSETKKKTKK